MYAESWAEYAALGWTPLPIPSGQKFPPPPGYTGADRRVVFRSQMRRWAEEQPDANIALPMPEHLIGIDLDAYHGGEDTLEKWERRLGELPGTIWSGSRRDGSGIFYYRVPEGLRFAHALKPGIEIIQPHHRYAVAPPSIHPEGRRYLWHGTRETPRTDGFPDLPEAWAEALAEAPGQPRKGFDGTVEDWLDALPRRRLSSVLAMEYNRKLRRLQLLPGSRHDTMCKLVNWLVHLGAEGHNVEEALNDLFVAFCSAVEGERDGDYEFRAALAWAVQKFGSAKRAQCSTSTRTSYSKRPSARRS